ncbi:MAG: DegV family protein [Anaerolineales bacterium]|jgi:DegV family protein with EDD domain
MLKTAIVTDSTADIPDDVVREYDIHVIPNILIIENQNFRDGIDLTRSEFYELLPNLKNPPTTATASAGSYQQLYENLFNSGYDQVISLHVSKEFSGVLNAASTAAQLFKSQVFVVDSKSVSLGLGFQVIECARTALETGDINTIVRRIKNLQPKIRLCAMLDTLEYLHRSGRVSWARARIGNLLRVKTFIEVKDGQARRIEDVRTRKKGIERLLFYLRSHGPLEKLAILHSNAVHEANIFLQAYNNDLKEIPFIVNVTTTIGTHVGPNGLGFAAVLK